MKKACIIIYNLGVGGAEQVAVSEVREFLRCGHAVHLVTLNPERSQTLMPTVPDNCQRTMVEFSSLFDVRAVYRLARCLMAIDPDIIITQLWFANTVGRLAARLAGMRERVIVFEHNVYDHLKSWKQFFADRLLQTWCKRIIAISDGVKASLVRHGINERHITIIYNAIDIKRHADAPSASIRTELGIGDEYLFICVARLVRQKGIDILLPAFAKVDGVLLLAGAGEDRAALEAQADALGIRSRVFFLGVRHDVPSLMKASDCFVLASRWEGFGIVLAEAMACGLPVVASGVDGIKEVVKDGETGILVPPEDPEALASALRRMQKDRGMAAAMGARGKERVQALFSIEKHVADIIACASA